MASPFPACPEEESMLSTRQTSLFPCNVIQRNSPSGGLKLCLLGNSPALLMPSFIPQPPLGLIDTECPRHSAELNPSPGHTRLSSPKRSHPDHPLCDPSHRQPHYSRNDSDLFRPISSVFVGYPAAASRRRGKCQKGIGSSFVMRKASSLTVSLTRALVP